MKVMNDGLEEGYRLVELDKGHEQHQYIESKMRNSIKEHNNGITFSSYSIIKVYKVLNSDVYRKYKARRKKIADEMGQDIVEEKRLFHGSPFCIKITREGFKISRAKGDNMFGAGIYFAENSSKSNQYAFGRKNPIITEGCPTHDDRGCYICPRSMLVCRVCLGKRYEKVTADRMCKLPEGYHSTVAVPGDGGVRYPEYVIYDSDQAYPGFLIEYTINRPTEQCVLL